MKVKYFPNPPPPKAEAYKKLIPDTKQSSY